MEVHEILSKCTRRLARIPGGWRMSEIPRRLYATRLHQQPNTRVTITDFDGNLSMQLDPSAYMGELIYWRGAYSLNELRLVGRRLSPEMTFVDIGANLGEFTLYAAKRLTRGRVLAFEPVPEVYRELEGNIARNGLRNVVALNFGLADKEKDSEMFTSDESEGKKNEGHPSMFTSPMRSVSVGRARFRVLDAVLGEHGVQRVDMVKIDVEGAELFVLMGASDTLSRMRPELLLELNAPLFASAGYTPYDLLKYLGDFGYQYFRVGRMGRLQSVEPSALVQTRFANVLCCPTEPCRRV